MIALTGIKIFIADIAATESKYLLQTLQRITAAVLYKFNYWRYKPFINPFCLRFFRYFYFNSASVSDASRPVMINNTNSVPNPSI